MITKKTKEQYQEAKEEIDYIREQAQKREVDLQQQLNTWTAEYTHTLQDREVRVTAVLQVADDESTAKLHDMEAKATTTLQAANGI